MPQKAHVTSLDALELFRSNLIVYLSQARPALEEVSAEVLRTRSWLETDQTLHWESQMRRRLKELEQAQQALFSSRLGALRKETAAEQFAVQRAKQAVVEAELKLRVLKKWNRDFEGRVLPLVKQMEKLHTIFSNDMVKAVTYLTQAIKTLAAYAERAAESQASLSNPTPKASAVGVTGQTSAETPGKLAQQPPVRESKP